MTRPEEIDAFLEAAGWECAARDAVAGDASARSYMRLRSRGRCAMLMDIPPASGMRTGPFVAITGWLRGLGLSAPEILACDPALGLTLLEDLGDDLYAKRCAAEPGLEPLLYGAAIDLLADLQRSHPAGTPDWSPPAYDREILLREMRLVPEWYLPAVRGGPVSADLCAHYEGAVEPLIAIALDTAPVPVLRDYHSQNLLWLPERHGPARVGLLDYQDLLMGHPAYDVVSLLQDARRDIPEALREALLARFVLRSGTDGAAFGRAAAALSAQRNLKILGLFVRLARRDGKAGYLRLLPRVWAHLQRDLTCPDLSGLGSFVARYVPAPEDLGR